ncbi:hypothetical protein [Chitiniphilus shinanonensis]|uniref:hypothetical protein n=1 Tax=Chitiniphilus shinanonensis TaxID=553088 RepID=UPI0030346F56
MQRYSTHLRNFVLGGGSYKAALTNAEIRIYSGAQPASADAAPTGTLLAVITGASAARVAETPAVGSVTLAGAGGQLDSLTIDGAAVLTGPVPYTTDLASTAALVARRINERLTATEYWATAAGAVVSIHTLPGTGAALNGKVVTATGSGGLTATTANLAGGADGSGGLLWGAPVGGVLDKLPSQVWSGLALASGNAGWFRICGGASDDHSTNPAHPLVFRVDGAIGVGTGELPMAGSTWITEGGQQTIGAAPLTLA